mmetsp:Transcript_45491/g.147841  ORF Transcript_45491/g.147841 Transcript_45491/m.147841 type:complete len:313 (+) Transcript_45491:34-972(+)
MTPTRGAGDDSPSAFQFHASELDHLRPLPRGLGAPRRRLGGRLRRRRGGGGGAALAATAHRRDLPASVVRHALLRHRALRRRVTLLLFQRREPLELGHQPLRLHLDLLHAMRRLAGREGARHSAASALRLARANLDPQHRPAVLPVRKLLAGRVLVSRVHLDALARLSQHPLHVGTDGEHLAALAGLALPEDGHHDNLWRTLLLLAQLLAQLAFRLQLGGSALVPLPPLLGLALALPLCRSVLLALCPQRQRLLLPSPLQGLARLLALRNGAAAAAAAALALLHGAGRFGGPGRASLVRFLRAECRAGWLRS